MNCPWCRHHNPEGAAYCGDCASPLLFDVKCAACGAGNPRQNRFCDACGAALNGAPVTEAPLPAAVAPEQEAPAAQIATSARPGRLWPVSWTLVAIALIVLLAAVIRLVSLTDVARNVTADEADNLQVVYHIMAGEGPGFFGLDWKPNPAFSMHMMSWFMGVFGESIVGMRMPSVVLSLLSLVAFYYVARQALSRHASLAATFLLGTSLWYLHFSRSGWENGHVALYALMTVLTLTLALRRGSWYLYAASGLFCALGLYGYGSGRTIILAVLLYLPVALVLQRQGRRRVLLGYAMLVAVCFTLVAPQAYTALSDWDLFNYRTNVVSIFNTGAEYRGDSGLPRILAHQVWRTIDGFFLMDSGFSRLDLNPRYLPPGRAILDRMTGALFWVGLVVSAFRLRRTALWWAMLLAMLFPVQVFSTGTPDAARAVGAVPFFFLFAGLGIDWLLSVRPGRILAARAVAVAVVLLIGYINVVGYFRWMDDPRTRDPRQPAVEVAEFRVWQELQKTEAEAGRWGFNVMEWHNMRGDYGY